MQAGGRLAAAGGLLVLSAGSIAMAADLPRSGAVMLDTIAPTAPRGFASGLPRSPLVDAVVNAGLRFATPAEAQRHCPDDDVVRVEPFSTVYHPARVPGPGAFMCKAAALQDGDLPR